MAILTRKSLFEALLLVSRLKRNCVWLPLFGKQRSALVASFEMNLSLAICEAATYFNIITNDGLHHILFPANVLKVELLYFINQSWNFPTFGKRNRSSHQRCSVRKGVLRNFIKFIGRHLCRVCFLIKLQVYGLQLYWKRDPGTGAFLWVFRNF